MGNRPSRDTELTPIGNSNQFEYELDFSPPYNEQVCFFWTCKNDYWIGEFKYEHRHNGQVKYMDIITELDIHAEQNTTVTLSSFGTICSWDVEVGDTTVPIFTGPETDFPFIFCAYWQVIYIRSNHPIEVTVRGRMLTYQQKFELLDTYNVERVDTAGRTVRFYKGLGMGYP